jgi:hypothetical protein
MPQTEELTADEIARLEELAAGGTDADRARMAAALADDADAESSGAPKRRRGRPPGSKNRPKADSVPSDGAGAGAGASGAAPSPTRHTRGAKVGREVGQQIASGGLIVAAFGDAHCGMILAQNGPALGDAYGKLADKNARVLAVMEGMVNGGVYAEVIVVTMAVLIPILAHHGLAPQSTAALFSTAPGAAQGPQGNPPTHTHTPQAARVPQGPPAQTGYGEG